MLKDIDKRRPDRQLERNLIFLAYAIMFLSLGLLSMLVYPQYLIYITAGIVFWCAVCILITIRILKVSENALSFGTMAAEIINDKLKYCRIDNEQGKAVLCNRLAADYFNDMPILEYLSKNIVDTNANRLDLQKLSSAVSKLQEASVTLSINPSKNSIFVAEEWLKVTVKPIYLNKTDIFEDEYSLKKIKKESYIFWTIENITSYKNMEEIFQNEMSSLQNFLDFLPVGLYTCDINGKIEYINDTLADYLYIDKTSAVGKMLDDFVAYKPEKLHQTNGVFNDNVVFSTKKGNREAFVKQQNTRDNQDLKTHGVVMWNLPNDDTLRNEIHLLLDKFEQLFNTVPIGIISLDNNQNILEINSRALQIFEKTGEDMLAHKIGTYFNEDALLKFNEAEKKYKQNHQQEYHFETTLKCGEETKNILLHICPLHYYHSSNSDAIQGMSVYIEDNTNKRNLEMQVAQAQKMQAFGQLAGGVAHDFNNLLTAVIGYCDLLIQRHGIGDPSFSDLVQLKQNANRAAGVARQLLAISRKQPLNPKIIEVTEAFTEIDHLLSRLLGEQIKFHISYGTENSYIRVDPVQFSQVMINLAINAKDAMNGKGTLSIATRLEHLSQAYQFGTDIVQPGDFIVISVSDTGCGIPEENINRIFEPFFSTKKNVVGSGTGLGLAMVYGIVRQTEGFIKVHSELGKGTTFEIYLPAYDNNKIEVKSASEEQSEAVILDNTGKAAMTLTSNVNIGEKMILGLNALAFDSQRSTIRNPGEIKILFVEDEDAVRSVGARGLRQKGFIVKDCISAENALEYIESGEKFDMMITDMMMPGINGAELASIMRQKNPKTLIILASGYSEEIARKELAGSQDFYFLSKPYSLSDLHKKVMEVLAKS